MTTFYRLERKDGKGLGAAFGQESVAQEICEKFNDRYGSEYRVTEVQDPPASEIGQASVIASLES
jgi:hypothetical protein